MSKIQDILTIGGVGLGAFLFYYYVGKSKPDVLKKKVTNSRAKRIDTQEYVTESSKNFEEIVECALIENDSTESIEDYQLPLKNKNTSPDNVDFIETVTVEEEKTLDPVVKEMLTSLDAVASTTFLKKTSPVSIDTKDREETFMENYEGEQLEEKHLEYGTMSTIALGTKPLSEKDDWIMVEVEREQNASTL